MPPSPSSRRSAVAGADARRRGGRLGWAALGLLLLGGGYYLLRPAPERAAPPAAALPVTVTTPQRQDVPLTVDALGTVAAMTSITLRSQVTGTLTEVLFTEGQAVARGQVLARVDDRSYRAALDSAEAKLAYDQAQLANARLDLRRYETLVRSQGTTQQTLDTQRAQVAMYEAQVRQDQASVDSARVDLDHTVIRAPIDGRVGLRTVDPGNLVTSSDSTGIVTVSQLSPIAVTFSLPQQDLARLRAAQAAGPVPVRTLAEGGAGAREGRIMTIDNSIDASTGTIKVKASFPNEEAALWPGAFVNLRVELERRQGVLTLPIVAIQRGPDAAFVFVVTGEGTVEKRPVTIAVQTAELAVIAQGLREGERVVTSGGLRLSPGAKVSVR